MPISFHAQPIRAAILILCLCACRPGPAADDRMSEAAADRHLVEVAFALDDKPSTAAFQTTVTLWISERNRGMTRVVRNWAVQGGETPTSGTLVQAAQCRDLLRPLDQPENLPDSPGRIVTVRCLDGGKTLVRRFPVDRVPPEVHRMLALMGFQEADYSRLRFAP